MKPSLASFAYLLLLALALPARAAVVDELIGTGSTSVTVASSTLNAADSVTYRIASGGTLFIKGSASGAGNGGSYYMGNGGLVKIGPDTPGGDGMAVFEGNSTANGGVFYINTSGTLMLENALFRSNTAATTAGAIFLNTNGGLISLKNVVFERNVATFAAGAMRFGGTTTMTGGGFVDNIGRDYGAIDMKYTGVPKLEMTDVYFTGNRGYWAGAIGTESSASRVWDVTLTNVTFNNNWAIYQGGALYVGISDTTTLVLNAASGTNAYSYTGNLAGNTVITSVTARMAPLLANAVPAAQARAGGFFYADRAATLDIDIAGGVSLTIGAAGDTGADSFASSGSYGTPALRKNGGGLLVLNADNSYWQGAVDVNSGTLLLGHAGAKLGGKITVAPGAVLGGAGVIETRNQAGALLAATSLEMQPGSVLQIGASSAAAQTLAVGGTLTLGAGMTLDFDTFGGASSDKLTASSLNVLGTGTLRLGSLVTGTYALLQWDSVAGLAEGDLAAWNAALVHHAPAARNPSAVLSISGTTLQLVASLDNTTLTWTGSAGGVWDHAAANWLEADAFADGDDVVFGADAGSRAITIADGEVRAKSMTVTGDADYSFAGDAIISSGTLAKTGAGTLTFTNTANTFAAVELAGGVTAFTAGAQLGVSGTGVVALAHSATLRPLATTTLDSPLAALGAGGGIDLSTGGTLTLAGTLSGDAPLTVAGAGKLILQNNANRPARLIVERGARLAAAAPGALGGDTANVSVDGATLEITAAGVVAKDVAINNGALVFAGAAALPDGAAMLVVPAGGSLVLANSSTIALAGSPLVSGRQYRLVHPEQPGAVDIAADTVFDLGAQNAGLDLADPYINPVTGDLIVTGVNEAVSPGKDVAAIFDALAAAATAVDARMGETLFNDTADTAASKPGRFWLRGFGSFGDYDSHGTAVGHRDTSYGALAGAEHRLADRLLLGVFAGHVSTSITTSSDAKTSARQPLGGVYAALRPGVFYASTDLMLGLLDADSTRREGDGAASGRYKADTFSGGVTLGARLGLWKNGAAQPFVSARYMRLAYRSQSETGTGAILLDDFTADRWQGLAAVRVSHAFGQGGANAKPSFVKGDTLTFATGAFSLLAGRRFKISGGDTTTRGVFRESGMDFFARHDAGDTDAIVLGGALTLDLTRAAALSLRYDCEFGGHHSRHDIGATLAWSW